MNCDTQWLSYHKSGTEYFKVLYYIWYIAIYILIYNTCWLPRWHSHKEYACLHQRHKREPWIRKIPGVGNGIPLQYPCLKNAMDREVWWVTVHGVSESWTWLNTWAHTQTQHMKHYYIRLYIIAIFIKTTWQKLLVFPLCRWEIEAEED